MSLWTWPLHGVGHVIAASLLAAVAQAHSPSVNETSQFDAVTMPANYPERVTQAFASEGSSPQEAESPMSEPATSLRTSNVNTDAGALTARDKEPTAIASRQNVFGIPFQVNRQREAIDAPQSMRLYVTTDLGTTWILAQEVDPATGTFMYRADKDGVYQFSLRSVDRQGAERPTGPHRAGLRVEVDTTPPELDLVVDRGQAGEVAIRWTASDATLDQKSLAISYQTSPYDALNPLAIGSGESNTQVATQRSGTAHWWPQQNAAEIFLRAEVADRAGNRTVRMARVPALPSPVHPPAEASPPLEAPRQDLPPSDSQANLVWSPDAIEGQPLETGGTGTIDPQFAADPFENSLANGSNVGTRYNLGGSTRPETAEPLPSLSGPPSQEVAYGRGELPAEDLMSTTTAEPTVQAVNSHQFEIDYDLAAAPTTDLLVEVWMTRDGGSHWTRQGVDTDRTSPAQVRVDADGLYGFRIVVQSPRGGTIAPQPGGKPETMLRIDTQRPELQLLGIANDPETGPAIRWYAKDQNEESVAIDLSYASNPGGPWETIASQLENTGSFTWRPAGDLPEWVYVRVEATDAAGNHHSVTSQRPVQIEPKYRSARILQIRPTVSAQRPAPTTRY
ncbi:MAG: Ig-like domain repeat protein [Planctomycetales bacterium]|nr:Ig-like domain repeat protein [Planctomycetales bacterium]